MNGICMKITALNDIEMYLKGLFTIVMHILLNRICCSPLSPILIKVLVHLPTIPLYSHNFGLSINMNCKPDTELIKIGSLVVNQCA